MHHDELWQIYAPNGEPISGAGWDSALNNPEETGSDAIVGIAIVFLYRVNGTGEIEFLWQRRSAEVDRHPGKWDISAGGHINLGESTIDAAIREAHEEIGAEITADDLIYGFMQPFNKNRLAWLYFVNWTGREDAFSFNDKEVSEVRWIKYSEMEEFRKNFAKAPLAKDTVAFLMVGEWLKMHGYLN